MRVLLLLAVVGCGGTDAARAAIAQSGRALNRADQLFGPLYDAARTAAVDTTDNWEGYDAKLVEWEAARSALLTAQSSLVAAEATLDATEAAESEGWFAAVEHAADALGSVREAFRNCGLDPPALLSAADAALRKLLDGAR